MKTILLLISVKDLVDYGALIVLAAIALYLLLQTFRRNNKYQDEEIKEFKDGLSAINNTLEKQHKERTEAESEWRSERSERLAKVGDDLREIKDSFSGLHGIVTNTVGRVDRLEADLAEIKRDR